MARPRRHELRLLQQAENSQAPAPPFDLADWQERDLEGRWILLMREHQQAPQRLRDVVNFLADGFEFELLEYLAIYVPGAFQSADIGDALYEMNAPE